MIHSDNKKKNVLAAELAAKHVKVVRRRRWVDDLPVPSLLNRMPLVHRRRHSVGVFVTVLQEPLNPARAVLRTSTLVPVGKQTHQPALPLPFCFHRAEEVVKNDLPQIILEFKCLH